MGTVAKKILLAEDDLFLRRACEISLRRQGYTVLVTADGEEALRMIHDEHPDLVLLDLLMPKMSGIEVLQAIRAEEKTKVTPVLVLTNSSTSDDMKKVKQLGVVGYMVKANLSLSALGDLIAEHLRD